MILATPETIYTMNTKTVKARADTIVVTDNIIGREVYYKGAKLLSSFLVPRKKYKVVANHSGLPIILDNTGHETYISFSWPCYHLMERYNWILAKRTNSKQLPLYTKSGREV